MTKQKFVPRRTFKRAFEACAHAWVDIFNTFGVNPPLEPMCFIPQVLALENEHLEGALIKNTLGLSPKKVSFSSLREHHAEKMKRELLALNDQLRDAFVFIDGKWFANTVFVASYNELVRESLIQCPHCMASHVADCQELHEKVGEGDIWRCFECDRYFTATPTQDWHISNSDWEYDDFLETLGAYLDRLERIGFDTIHIEGRNLNWRNASGEHSFTIRDGEEELFRVLSIGNDFRLRFEGYFDGTASSWCSHHDANSAMDLVPGVTDENGYFISHEGLEEARRLNLLAVALGDYDIEYLSPEGFAELLCDIEHFLGEGPASEIAQELGASMSVSVAENLVELADMAEL